MRKHQFHTPLRIAENWRGYSIVASQGIIEDEATDRYQYYFVPQNEKALATESHAMTAKPYRQVGAALAEVRRRLAEFREAPSVYPKLEEIQ